MKKNTGNAKGAARDRAQHKPASPDSLDRSIVSRIIDADMADYLDQDDAEAYTQARDEYRRITDAREREMREKHPDIDRDSDEYQTAYNALYRHEAVSAWNTMARLQGVAQTTFLKRYTGHDAELTEALRIVSTRRIVNARENVNAQIERNGWTGNPREVKGMSTVEILVKQDLAALERAQRWDEKTHPVEYAIVETFSPFALDVGIRQNCELVIRAMSGDGYKRADAMIKRLIAERWTLKPIDGHSLINTRGDVTLLASRALMQMQTANARTAQYNDISRTYEHTWEATKVYIADGAKPYTNNTVKILYYLTALLYMKNRGDKDTRISHAPNVKVYVGSDEIMRMFGWENAESVRTMLRAAFKTMTNTIIETKDYYSYKDNKGRKRRKQYASGNPRIISSVKAVRGKGYDVYFDAQFAEYLLGSFALDVPVEYFSASANASAIIVKLADHAKMNRNKSNARTISARALIEACPEIETSDVHGHRITEKLDKALEELEEANVIKCEYREAGMKPLSRPSILDYDKSEIMNDIYVLFEIVHTGDTVPLPEPLDLPTE